MGGSGFYRVEWGGENWLKRKEFADKTLALTFLSEVVETFGVVWVRWISGKDHPLWSAADYSLEVLAREAGYGLTTERDEK